MGAYLDISKLYSLDVWVFFAMLLVFIVSRYFLRSDIEKKEHGATDIKKLRTQNIWFYGSIIFIAGLYIVSLFLDIEFLANIVKFVFSLSTLYIISLVIQRKILLVYGQEVEVSGQKYFKKWYKVSLFSLFVNIFTFLIAIFLCIEIFELDTLLEIWGLWAWILAFMWFTAPVWALDMIAGIILLQSKNFETGNVFYIYERKLYIWIKSISLTEVKCIDLRTGNPIMFRPSQFRNLSLKNLSQWISGKTNKILREKVIHVDYKVDFIELQKMCYEAFDTMQVDLLSPEWVNYFWDDPYRSLEIEEFSDYAISYKLFYSISSPFYIFKAERLLNEYLLSAQKDNNIYFATPDLLQVEKKDSL